MTKSKYKKYLEEITRQLKIIFLYNPFLNLNDKREMTTQKYIYNRYKVKLKPEQLERLNKLLENQEKKIKTKNQEKIKHLKRKNQTPEEINALIKKEEIKIKQYNKTLKQIEHLKEELKNPMKEEQKEIIKRQIKTLNIYIKNEQIKEDKKQPLYIKKIQTDIINPLNAYNRKNHYKKIDPYKIICVI